MFHCIPSLVETNPLFNIEIRLNFENKNLDFGTDLKKKIRLLSGEHFLFYNSTQEG